MGAVRKLIVTAPGWTLVLMLVALAVRLVVPAGFMPERQGGRTVMVLCTGHGPLVIATARHDRPAPADSRRDDPPCGYGAFADLGSAGTPAALPTVALVFIMARSLAPRVAAPTPPVARLRPPLRAPPGSPAFGWSRSPLR